MQAGCTYAWPMCTQLVSEHRVATSCRRLLLTTSVAERLAHPPTRPWGCRVAWRRCGSFAAWKAGQVSTSSRCSSPSVAIAVGLVSLHSS